MKNIAEFSLRLIKNRTIKIIITLIDIIFRVIFGTYALGRKDNIICFVILWQYNTIITQTLKLSQTIFFVFCPASRVVKSNIPCHNDIAICPTMLTLLNTINIICKPNNTLSGVFEIKFTELLISTVIYFINILREYFIIIYNIIILF